MKNGCGDNSLSGILKTNSSSDNAILRSGEPSYVGASNTSGSALEDVFLRNNVLGDDQQVLAIMRNVESQFALYAVTRNPRVPVTASPGLLL